MGPPGRRARSGQSCADDVPGRRESRPGGGCGGERRANRAANGTGVESAVHRPLAGRRGARIHARLRDVRIYRIALNESRSRRFAVTRSRDRRRRRPRRAAAGDLDGRNPAGIATRLAVVERPRHHGRDDRRHTAPPAGRVAGGLSRERRGPDVRVIWPSPVDNSEVMKPGTYTVTGKVPGTSFAPKATVIVKVPVGTLTPPSRLVEPFALSDVVLERDTKGRDTPFIRNRDKFVRGLAASNPDNFLYNFRDAFGQPQPAGATQLEGWDNQTTRLRGHASGHYLTAIAQAYASTTYDEALRANFLQKMNYLIDTLYDLSQKSGRPATQGGPPFLTRRPFPQVPGVRAMTRISGRARSAPTTGIGASGSSARTRRISSSCSRRAPPTARRTRRSGLPTTHSTRSSLVCSTATRSRATRRRSTSRGAWVRGRTRGSKALPPETRISMWNRYIAGEYGGMNEVMARLFRLTGDKQFLDGAKLFDNTNFFFGNAAHDHGLAKNVDTIRGRHANQHIPQITGALETFRNTKEMPYYLIASNFWDIVNRSYMYSIGGVAGARTPNNAECFTAQPDTLWQNGFAQGGQNETCATYNLLKLDRQLFMYDQTAKYMDHYEQALYNHILASVAEDDPGTPTTCRSTRVPRSASATPR